MYHYMYMYIAFFSILFGIEGIVLTIIRIIYPSKIYNDVIHDVIHYSCKYFCVLLFRTK